MAIQMGCLDPQAANYNAMVNTDDGSCVYTGCTDPLATNYVLFTHPLTGTQYPPTIDDGSCLP